MNKLLLAAALVVFAAPAALAASNEDCTAMWKKLDTKSEGKISGDAAKPYLTAMDTAKMPASMAKDGVIMDTEFMDACMKDAFKGMQ